MDSATKKMRERLVRILDEIEGRSGLTDAQRLSLMAKAMREHRTVVREMDKCRAVDKVAKEASVLIPIAKLMWLAKALTRR
jgi:hypothetical protein